MNRFLGAIFLLSGIIVLFIGQWMAFEIYANEKLKHISQNMARFTYGLYSGESFISIPKSSENIFIIRANDGRIVTTNNVVSPVNVEGFTFSDYAGKGTYVYVYSKKITLSDYIMQAIEKPIVLGTSFSGLILTLFGLVLSLKYKQPGKVDQKALIDTESLIKSLKAVRVALAMGELIPRESLQEAKKIVEDIIKKMEGRG